MGQVRWSVPARRDLLNIRAYISRDSTAYAVTVSRRLITAAEPLRDHPRLGRVVPELGDETIRELIAGNYRLIYRLIGDDTEVLRVIHGGQDLLSQLR